MKRKIIVLSMLAALCSAAFLAGCGEESQSSAVPAATSSSTPNESSSAVESKIEPAAETGKGDIGDYNIEILGVRIVDDFQGGKDALVKLKFTNISDEEAAAFGSSLDIKVYQDGVELGMGVPDAEGYEAGNSYKTVKKGASIEFEHPVQLSNTTSPIEVEVAELFAIIDTGKVTKTLELPQE